ncbi:MATE family efflux transporter [Breznakiella homolactica]|uniref:Multidrug-efflux transporter n=2 Tax=Breznakiella homolactica TaxID=2798577 RepID=A0A7T7XRX6_9SPIR|nr:MATE family efflux transporter [Breznakiella homolactica]
MGTMPVNRLLISMSLPMVVAMVIQALYNIVDSLFVARLGEDALTAVSLAFPIQNAMIAIATGTGVGINALLSKSLGEKNFKEANRTANNGIFLGFLSYLLFLVFGLIGSRWFFAIQTDIGPIVDYGFDYLFIITVAGFGVFGQITFDRLLQATGRSFYTMLTQGTGAIINIILDPIFIFGLFGFPALGVKGAALATVIGQWIAMALSIIFNLRFNHDIRISLKGFRPNLFTIKGIYSVGVPSIIMASIGSVMNFGVNKILLALSSTAAAVFGVYYKLQSFIFMPVFGINNGLVPIIAYNFGARKKDRIKKSIICGFAYATAIMVLGFLIFQIFPARLLALFNASDTMIEIGVRALRVISISFIGAGFCIITSTVLQALFNSKLSMFVSIARQLVVLLPAAFILSEIGGLRLVWWSFPIAEIASVCLSAVFLRKVYNKEVRHLSPDWAETPIYPESRP